MNADIIKANWKQLKGSVKKQWGKLTDDEVMKMQGTSEELIGRLQEKYGYEKERAQKEIEAFAKKYGREEDEFRDTE